MTEEARQEILQWIFDNHMHHDHTDVLVSGDGGVGSEYDEDFVNCEDSDMPYVNSLELEKFIKELK